MSNVRRLTLNKSTIAGNSTQLVFCRENVDPNVVTRLLELTPTESLQVGDSARYSNGHPYKSRVGLWKLDLPNADPDQCVEEQVAKWLDLLQPRAVAFRALKELDYHCYLDCKAASGSLSLCIEPELLSQLGMLRISLSVWLYEQESAQDA